MAVAAGQDRRVRSHSLLRTAAVTLVGTVALYLVGRGIAELFIVPYSDPRAYSHDWGGPTLLGVLAVHTGPAVILVVASALLLFRRRRRRKLPTGHR